MAFPYILNKNIYYSLNNTFIKLSSLRYLEKNQNGTSTYNNYKKKQLIELYIIIAVLAAIIINAGNRTRRRLYRKSGELF